MNEFYEVAHYWAGDDEPATYIVECGHVPSVEEVVEALGLDYEPDKGETITIELTSVVYIEEAEAS